VQHDEVILEPTAWVLVGGAALVEGDTAAAKIPERPSLANACASVCLSLAYTMAMRFWSMPVGLRPPASESICRRHAPIFRAPPGKSRADRAQLRYFG
jgi:hypothetical protein